MAAKEGGQIHDVVIASGVFGVDGRNNFQAAQDALQFRGDAALQGAHHDVLPALFAAPALVEHAERLADAGSVAEKDLEASAAFAALVGLDFAEKFLGVGACAIDARHPHQDNPARRCGATMEKSSAQARRAEVYK